MKQRGQEASSPKGGGEGEGEGEDGGEKEDEEGAPKYTEKEGARDVGWDNGNPHIISHILREPAPDLSKSRKAHC